MKKFVIPLGILFFIALAIFRGSHNIDEIERGDILGRVGPFLVEIADEPREHIKGLSFRKGLNEGRGMLFVFPEDGFHKIWMKDMNFSIDIAWLDERGRVVYIVEEVSPSTYPDTFVSDREARYVLEVKSGELTDKNIGVGDFLNIR